VKLWLGYFTCNKIYRAAHKYKTRGTTANRSNFDYVCLRAAYARCM